MNALSAETNPSAARGENRRAGLELLLLSAAVLFLELAIIRWGGARVRVLAYFPNLLLIAAFLGLGLGCLRAGGRSLGAWWMPSLAGLALAFTALGRIVFTQKSTEEHLWLLYYDLPKDALVIHNVWAPVLLCFGLTAACFIAPGQMIATRLKAFQARRLALRGYGWDLAGSFVGATLFSVAAFKRLEPLHWFLIVVLAVAWLERRSLRRLLGAVLCGGIVLATVGLSERSEIYSPYYGLATTTYETGVTSILANGSVHQTMIDLYPRDTNAAATTAEGYSMPYVLSGHKPRHALVLGAGSGNDVASLLRQGALTVDAVEIDPEIIAIGRRLHPNHPYDDPRVTVHNTDARVFLNNATGRYDTIIFGTLDSMTRLSALSNVRLDNFVYTTDCLAAARRLLTDDGGMILHFMTPLNFIDTRIEAMIARVFGRAPAVHAGRYNLFNKIFMAGPAFDHIDLERRARMDAVLTPGALAGLDLPDDDWPYLYLAGRNLGSFYRIMIPLIGLCSLGAVLAASKEFRTRVLAPGGTDAPMFLFGFAFLLLETRAVTAMSLAWGTTWLTNAVVFGAVLLTVLAGTLAYARFPLRLGSAIAGLTVSLLALYLLPPGWLLTAGVPVRLALSCLVVGLPVLFASAGFAHLYASRREVGHAFGWNLLGAVAGGLTESLSMVFGLRALLLLALVAYLFAYVRHRQDQARHAPAKSPAPDGPASEAAASGLESARS